MVKGSSVLSSKLRIYRKRHVIASRRGPGGTDIASMTTGTRIKTEIANGLDSEYAKWVIFFSKPRFG